MSYDGFMVAQLLTTKLYIPPPRPGIVSRLRLIEQLNEGLSSGHKLTLVSASAGFGKTTLVSEWIAQSGLSVAWLSLDEGDSDPVRFITYLIAALKTIKAGIGETLLAAIPTATNNRNNFDSPAQRNQHPSESLHPRSRRLPRD